MKEITELLLHLKKLMQSDYEFHEKLGYLSEKSENLADNITYEITMDV